MNKALNVQPAKLKIQKIESGNKILTKETEMANEFNNFFAEAGVKISNAVKKTEIKPESY